MIYSKYVFLVLFKKSNNSYPCFYICFGSSLFLIVEYVIVIPFYLFHSFVWADVTHLNIYRKKLFKDLRKNNCQSEVNSSKNATQAKLPFISWDTWLSILLGLSLLLISTKDNYLALPISSSRNKAMSAESHLIRNMEES